VDSDDDSTPVSVSGSVDVDASVVVPLVVGAAVDGSVVDMNVVVNGPVVVSSPLPPPGHAASPVQTERAATIRLDLLDMITSAPRDARPVNPRTSDTSRLSPVFIHVYERVPEATERRVVPP
jgi:hypothetical protein